jgi:Rho termination factor, N-terminal domain
MPVQDLLSFAIEAIALLTVAYLSEAFVSGLINRYRSMPLSARAAVRPVPAVPAVAPVVPLTALVVVEAPALAIVPSEVEAPFIEDVEFPMIDPVLEAILAFGIALANRYKVSSLPCLPLHRSPIALLPATINRAAEAIPAAAPAPAFIPNLHGFDHYATAEETHLVEQAWLQHQQVSQPIAQPTRTADAKKTRTTAKQTRTAAKALPRTKTTVKEKTTPNQPTIRQLQALAKQKKIPNYSRMNKAQLLTALAH